VNFDAASSKRANFNEIQFFLKHTPKLIIFGTHNLRTCTHNTLINELLLMMFYLFNIRPKLHDCITGSDENYACTPSTRDSSAPAAGDTAVHLAKSVAAQ